MIVLHLPWPPSVNSANGFSKRGYYPSAAKDKFFREADSLYMIQKRGLKRVDGPFTYHIVLNRQMRHGLADGDNRLKYVLDYAQRVELIENDKLAEGGSWSWGDCEHGAMLSIHPVCQDRCHECGWGGGGIRDEGCLISPCPRNQPVNVASALSETQQGNENGNRTQRTA